MKTIWEVAKAPIAMQNRMAAAVMILPVLPTPTATASVSSMPLSRASLMRESRNTP